jgi:hypothetical protein
MSSDRENLNNNRLATNWRPVWTGIFQEFPNIEFIFHHIHDNYKMDVSFNVRTEIYNPSDMKKIPME